MASTENTPQALIAQGQALIDQVQRELTAQEDELLRQGVDLERLRAGLEPRLNDAQRQQVQQAIAADMEAVEQEVREEWARRSFAQPAAAGRAPLRSMV